MNRLGKYEIHEVLGKGSSGIVYRAVDTFNNQVVAIKMLNRDIVRNSEAGQIHWNLFINEASLAGRLNHPHIVSLLEAAVDDDGGYIAMEYVSGGNLSQYANGGKSLTPQDVIQIGFKCCGALDFAMKLNVVHRDIKPANIMVSSSTGVKIADFGAAYFLQSEKVQLHGVGSPSYMSPEQISQSELSYHSDMYSLGVVLYELLAGKPPFVAANAAALFHKALHEMPAAPSAHRPGIDEELDQVVLRAISRKPEDRFENWSDFAMALVAAGRLDAASREIPDSEKYFALRRIHALADLDERQLWDLARVGRWQRIAPRSSILRESDEGNSMFFITEGEVKVTRDGKLLNVLKAGDCFGELAYATGETTLRHASVEAMTDVVVVELASGPLKSMSEHSQLLFARALLRTVVDRLALANVRIARVVS